MLRNRGFSIPEWGGMGWGGTLGTPGTRRGPRPCPQELLHPKSAPQPLFQLAQRAGRIRREAVKQPGVALTNISLGFLTKREPGRGDRCAAVL